MSTIILVQLNLFNKHVESSIIAELIKKIMETAIWPIILPFVLLFGSGIATEGSRGAECHPWQQKNCQKSGKRRRNRGKKRKNREQKAKIGKDLSLCPSWQIDPTAGYATAIWHVCLQATARVEACLLGPAFTLSHLWRLFRTRYLFRRARDQGWFPGGGTQLWSGCASGNLEVPPMQVPILKKNWPIHVSKITIFRENFQK